MNIRGGVCSTDNFQNLMVSSLYHPRHFQKISLKSVHNFLSNPANRQTDRQANKRTNKPTLPKTLPYHHHDSNSTVAIMMIIMIITMIEIMMITIIITISTRRVQTFARRVHSESANLLQGHGSLPKFHGLLLVPTSIFPENFIEIRS